MKDLLKCQKAFNGSDKTDILIWLDKLKTSIKLKKVEEDLTFFTDSSLQASQEGTKTQEVTKEEEKRRI